MNTGLITKIIKKFLEGNCSDEEFAYLLYWYESFDDNPVLQITEEDKELLRNKILLRMRQNIPELQPGQPDIAVTVMDEGHPARRSWWKYGLAAAVAGAILFLLFRPSGEVALPGSAMRQMPEAPRLISYSNVTGRLHLLLLPDSSKVWVSPNSSIRYLEKFAAERKVTLQGEAFFEIAKSAGHPFIVSSGDLVTRVMGTSFLLKAYQGKTAEISVVTGKVAVSRKDKMDKQIILTAKERAVLNTAEELVKDTLTGKTDIHRWENVNLTFNNLPLRQVITALNKEFNIRIYCHNEAMNQFILNADFNNQNLGNILEMLEKSLGIRYEFASDNVINLYEEKN